MTPRRPAPRRGARHGHGPMSIPAIAVGLAACSAVPASSLQEEEAPWIDEPHHLSVVAAGTHAADEDAPTAGIDYEYRLNRILGVGAVAEYAFEPFNATTVLAVADIHIWRGLGIQTGPGVVLFDSEQLFVYRIGGLYEFELGGGMTISPQLHYEITDSEADAFVYAIALGVGF
ncbi:MAG: hypothetical protein AAF957_03170 [Planctomycetota bacterium]